MNNFNSFLIFLFRKGTKPESNQPLNVPSAETRKKVKLSPMSPLANLLLTTGPGSYAGACFTK